MRDIEELAALAIDNGLRIHKELGPGLLESVYEAVLAASLSRAGLKRVVNNHDPFAPSRLRVNQPSLIQAARIDE